MRQAVLSHGWGGNDPSLPATVLLKMLCYASPCVEGLKVLGFEMLCDIVTIGDGRDVSVS